ncbi:MAG TPA: hypothetical protein VJN70_14550 [Gemmatimonadaceae bacterium]|nr:hypothetical protein [Gemmatimonadaceae bacterium]
MTKRDSIRIDLTADQQQQIKDAFGGELSSLELDMRELEQRIAPVDMAPLYIQKFVDKSSPVIFN